MGQIVCDGHCVGHRLRTVIRIVPAAPDRTRQSLAKSVTTAARWHGCEVLTLDPRTSSFWKS